MEAPVWLWLEGSTTPVRVGTLTRNDTTGGGSFLYDADYAKAGGRALDTDELRHINARQPIPIPANGREGIPGRIADAGPDAWGRMVLAQDLGFVPNALEALIHAADDGAGNLAVGDLNSKPKVDALDLEELAQALLRRQAGQPVRDEKLQTMLSPDTALGGAKPKATVFREGHQWIAKYPERGDPANLPYFEAAALRMAGRLSIDSARAEVIPLPAGRSILLVKRFDRGSVTPEGATRLGFASALTVMGAGGMQALSSFRTYLYLAKKLKTWVRDALPGVLNQLWERIVFNALVGNGDDHPRNHGLLLEGIQWRLSPMFDVVPARYRLERLSLAMPYLRLATGQETSLVTAQYLVQAAPTFGLDVETARSRLLAMATRTIDEWPDVLSELKAPADVTHETRPTLDWTRQILTQATSLSVDDCRPIAVKSNRRWQWAP